MTQRVDEEQQLLQARGIRAIRIEPGPAELGSMGANFMDIRRRRATLEAARVHLPATINKQFSEQP